MPRTVCSSVLRGTGRRLGESDDASILEGFRGTRMSTSRRSGWCE